MEQTPGTLEPDDEALSYCWGVETTERFIEPDGKQFQTTPNLYGALQHLRFERLTRTLWIDRVCMNQRDVGERNQQVRLSHSIYARASPVTAWLGKATTASDILLGALSHVDDRAAELKRLPTTERATRGASHVRVNMCPFAYSCASSASRMGPREDAVAYCFCLF